jgi:hypothetical protein
MHLENTQCASARSKQIMENVYNTSALAEKEENDKHQQLNAVFE